MNITVNIPETILSQADQQAARLHLKRSEYVRRALEQMNQTLLIQARYTRLQQLSQRVREESSRINLEFEAIDDFFQH